eukprot:gene447-230_t
MVQNTKNEGVGIHNFGYNYFFPLMIIVAFPLEH